MTSTQAQCAPSVQSQQQPRSPLIHAPPNADAVRIRGTHFLGPSVWCNLFPPPTDGHQQCALCLTRLPASREKPSAIGLYGDGRAHRTCVDRGGGQKMAAHIHRLCDALIQAAASPPIINAITEQQLLTVDEACCSLISHWLRHLPHPRRPSEEWNVSYQRLRALGDAHSQAKQPPPPPPSLKPLCSSSREQVQTMKIQPPQMLNVPLVASPPPATTVVPAAVSHAVPMSTHAGQANLFAQDRMAEWRRGVFASTSLFGASKATAPVAAAASTTATAVPPSVLAALHDNRMKDRRRAHGRFSIKRKLQTIPAAATTDQSLGQIAAIAACSETRGHQLHDQSLLIPQRLQFNTTRPFSILRYWAGGQSICFRITFINEPRKDILIKCFYFAQDQQREWKILQRLIQFSSASTTAASTAARWKIHMRLPLVPPAQSLQSINHTVLHHALYQALDKQQRGRQYAVQHARAALDEAAALAGSAESKAPSAKRRKVQDDLDPSRPPDRESGAASSIVTVLDKPRARYALRPSELQSFASHMLTRCIRFRFYERTLHDIYPDPTGRKRHPSIREHIIRLLKPPGAFERFALSCFHALQAHHDAGVLLRDIKPANIFLEFKSDQANTDYLHPVFGDYGYAAVCSDGSGRVRLKETTVGTHGFRAPEVEAISDHQHSSQKHHTTRYYSTAADVYSLASTLIDVCAGDFLQTQEARLAAATDALASIAPGMDCASVTPHWIIPARGATVRCLHWMLHAEPSERATLNEVCRGSDEEGIRFKERERTLHSGQDCPFDH